MLCPPTCPRGILHSDCLGYKEGVLNERLLMSTPQAENSEGAMIQDYMFKELEMIHCTATEFMSNMSMSKEVWDSVP